MACTHSVPNLEGAHRRHGAKLLAELRHDRSACGRDEFVGFVALSEWDAAKDLEGRGRGDREATVFALDPAPSLFEGRDVDALNAKGLDPDANADNVCDGIERSDLVEMDRFGGGAVDFGFGYRDPRKNREGVLFDEGREGTGFKQCLDVRMGAFRLMGVGVGVRVRVVVRVIVCVIVCVIVRVIV